MPKKKESANDPEDIIAPDTRESAEPEERTSDNGDAQTVESHDDATNEPKDPMPIAHNPIKSHLIRFWRKRKLTIPISVIVLLVIVGLIPAIRYPIVGLALKRSYTITIVDSKTNTPVTNADIVVGGKTYVTNNEGKTSFTIGVGSRSVKITKKYYKDLSQNIFIGIGTGHNTTNIQLVATGRTLALKVVDKINNQPIANVEIKVLDTDAKTDKNGNADVVIPLSSPSQTAKINAAGYDDASATLQITNTANNISTIALTPSGRVYFLSNLSGKIDVVSTDLDGSSRKTVVAGTGNETPYGTALLASRDWKYLALFAQRKSTGGPEIDLIDTSTDTMSNIDEGDANFSLIGWDGDKFVYQVDRNNVPEWQNGHEALKSFDAPTKAITTLAQTKAIDLNGSFVYLYQQFGSTNIAGGKVLYALNWSRSNTYLTNQQQASLSAVNPDGSSNVVVKSFTFQNPNAFPYFLSIAASPYEGPNNLKISFSDGVDNPSFYVYQNGTVSAASDITNENFYNSNDPTYLLSPSGNQTFWTTYADGKNNLEVGDQNGQGGKAIAQESDYTPYGWFTDNYLLVSKDASELYVMAKDGSGQPIKISNYYKPQNEYRGYGGGYGGL